MTARLPDFLLIGAMRAGTTTLHHLLAAHPGCYLPERELFFFDSDDLEEHAEEHVGPDGRWRRRDFEAELPEALPAYMAQFAAAGARLAGEDSTTYLTAEAAPARARRLVPEAKILVILRDPVERAWSHYWHLVASGRAVLPFEASLVSARGTLLRRSTYAPGLRRWQGAFGRERVLALISEELWADPATHLGRVCEFLGLEGRLDLAALPPEARHRHAAEVPRWPAIRRLANQLARTGAAPARRPGGLPGLLVALAGRAPPGAKPPLDPDTRAWLGEVLAEANAGLPDLLGRSLEGVWGVAPV